MSMPTRIAVVARAWAYEHGTDMSKVVVHLSWHNINELLNDRGITNYSMGSQERFEGSIFGMKLLEAGIPHWACMLSLPATNATFQMTFPIEVPTLRVFIGHDPQLNYGIPADMKRAARRGWRELAATQGRVRP